MKRILKVLLAVFAVLVIIVVAFGAFFFLDLVAFTANSSKTLAPQGTSVGDALVVYDPGLSGTTTRVAEQVAADLQAKGYTVILAGVKSAAAANTAGYTVIVVGSPIYAGAPASSVKEFLNGLNPDSGVKIGVFGSGSGATSAEDIAMIRNAVPALQSGGALSGAVVVKIGQNEDFTARSSELVNQLVS
jgi:flavodoxin